MAEWVYRKTEPGLWTVGHYSPTGHWEPESDHGSPEGAANRVRFLSGGNDERVVSFLRDVAHGPCAVDEAARREADRQMRKRAAELLHEMEKVGQ